MNSTITIFHNQTTTDQSVESSHNQLAFSRHEFLTETPAVAIPCLIVVFIASVAGTFGNVLIIVAVATQKSLRNKESIFIFNLAVSDMYVTLVADPMSIVAKVEGEEFFDKIPYLCTLVASLCTMSCISSLGSIACLSLNRYIHICHNNVYNKIFTKEVCFVMCLSLYAVGSFMVLLNLAGIGDHGFDRKSLECIWDRMATFPYTVVFSITLVWIPILVTGFSYLNLYIHVKRSHKRIQQHVSDPDATANRRNIRVSVHLARTIFIVYAVFSTCWIPYALLIVLDKDDTFSHIVHLYIVVFAHLHPSINWLVYYLTNKKFAFAFDKLVGLSRCIRCRTWSQKPTVINVQSYSIETSNASSKHRLQRIPS